MKKTFIIYLVLVFLVGCKSNNNVPLAYAPIRFEEAASAFIENDEGLTEEAFYDLSNSIRVLYNCGIVSFSRIESVKEVENLLSEEETDKYHIHFYRIQCSCDNQSFIIGANRWDDSDQLDIIKVSAEERTYFPTENWWRDYKRENPEESRQISITNLEEYCNLNEEEAKGLMNEIDLLFSVLAIKFHDIASIEHAERDKDTVSLSVMSNFGDPYTVVISTVNRPIILSITDAKGQVLYESTVS